MTMFKRLKAFLAVLFLVLAGLIISPTSAYATSNYDDLIIVDSKLIVYTDGPAKSETMDISNTWLRDLKQTYARRVALNVPGFPADFIPRLESIINDGGSWGIYTETVPSGKEISVVATTDPNASCVFNTVNSVQYLECPNASGYDYLSISYFTHNSFGGNGCAYSRCSANGMAVYADPTLITNCPGQLCGFNISDIDSRFSVYMLNYNINYPTGYEGAIIPSQKTLDYVALGDSFASGEGVEPFFPETDTVTNSCHRSEKAYSELLDKENSTSVNLNLTAFVACSGAITDNINAGGSGTGAWNEAAQTDSLATSTDVVTISVGGNDAQFGPTFTTCNYMQQVPSSWVGGQYDYDEFMCLNAIEDSQNIINGITLIDGDTFTERLEQTYLSILSQVGNDTQIYVLGYPDFYPELENVQTICRWGYNLNAQGTSYREVSEDEINLIRSTNNYLSNAIQSTVASMGNPNIHFIDTRPEFEDHQLCTDTPFITKINVSNPSGSFHPNELGQAAFAKVLKEAID